jgi:eukaryotic-like serine/threonine-protein kinase
MRNTTSPVAGALTRDKGATQNDVTVIRKDRLRSCLFDDKYELHTHLGTGGMGTVYRARRVYVGDEVAVKVLHPSRVKSQESIERFRREARAIAMLRHPNVVALYDYRELYSERVQAYLVMELVPGMTLGQLLKHEGCLTLNRAITLMSDVCAGVGAAHQQGIVHRDLKPENILVVPPRTEAETEQVKVVDFGIAKLGDSATLNTLTQTGMVMGTPYYMSPEQCLGEELDARSDVYSLGILFYEMLAGRRPFIAATLTGLIAKHLNEAPPPLPKHLGVPPAVEAVIHRALAKERTARPADALMLTQELQAALSSSKTMRVSKPAMRKPLVCALIVALMLLGLGLGTQTSLAGLEEIEPDLQKALVTMPRPPVNRPYANAASSQAAPANLPQGMRGQAAVSVPPESSASPTGNTIIYLPRKLRGALPREVLAQLSAGKSNNKVTIVFFKKKKKKHD